MRYYILCIVFHNKFFYYENVFIIIFTVSSFLRLIHGLFTIRGGNVSQTVWFKAELDIETQTEFEAEFDFEPESQFQFEIEFKVVVKIVFPFLSKVAF